MRYLRVLTNSAIAGALMAGYLLVATLHLNPSFPLGLTEVGPLAIALGLAYGANCAGGVLRAHRAASGGRGAGAVARAG